MDSRYFSNFKILEKLNDTQIKQLHNDLKRTVQSASSINTKRDGSMVMRFSVNKSLVSIFNRYG